jgi:hypothetical protein
MQTKTGAGKRPTEGKTGAGPVRSMTGYGRATVENGGRVTAEVRAVNGRFFKLSMKVLGRYAALEERIKTVLAEAGVKRGSIEVSLFFEDAAAGDGRDSRERPSPRTGHPQRAARGCRTASDPRRSGKPFRQEGPRP